MSECKVTVKLDCRWQRVEPDAQVCLVCGEVAWLNPLELFMAVEGQPLKPTGMFICSSCGEEGNFKA